MISFAVRICGVFPAEELFPSLLRRLKSSLIFTDQAAFLLHPGLEK